MRTVVVMVVMLLSSTASADPKPTLDEVKDAVVALDAALVGDGARSSRNEKLPKAQGQAFALTSRAFWYDGFRYEHGFDDENAVCKRTWGGRGTVAADRLKTFFPCMAIAGWNFGLGPSTEWSVVPLAKLPAKFKKHKTRLGKLAGDHVFVISKSSFALSTDEAAESWNLYAATKADDGVHITAVLHWYRAFEIKD